MYNNISVTEIISYTEFAGAAGNGGHDIFGHSITIPVLQEDLPDNAGHLDRWLYFLSQNYKRTDSEDTKKLLLKLNNLECLEEKEYETLDIILGREKAIYMKGAKL